MKPKFHLKLKERIIYMEINLSAESVEVIMNSLRDSKRSLNQQIDKWDRINEPHKAEICCSLFRHFIVYHIFYS